MKHMLGFFVLLGFFVMFPVSAFAQSNASLGAPSSSLQGAGAALQQPGAGFQGTTPQNLTAPALSTLNQNTHDVTGSTVRIRPSETSTIITPIKEPDSSSSFQLIILAVVFAVAGYALGRRYVM